MKKWIISFLLYGCYMATSCKEDKLETYHAANYVQFADPSSDSVTVAFVFSPGKDTISVPMVAFMSGLAGNQATPYAISVSSTGTTAEEGRQYTLPAVTSFEPGQVTDTSNVCFFRTADMQQKAFRLVVQVAANDHFLPGDLAYQTKTFIVHDMIAQPAWWNADIIKNYLGAYSDQKYRLLIEQTGVSDLAGSSVSEKRAAAIQLKYWLAREKAAGRTVWDNANNQEMTVPVKG
ncbi:protein of unknown function [bacterium A37T11]|nr:protein of unknown function [bacterium A37T11]